MNLDALSREFDFSPAEFEFIKNSGTSTTSEMNQSRVIADFIVAKRIERAAVKIIESNERLAVSNDRHARAMRYLTLALVFVGVVQVVVSLLMR